MKKLQTQHLTRAAAVGAAYAVLSLFSSVFSLTFGVVQCRFSEALCVLPFSFRRRSGACSPDASSPIY